jgi:hypothetical protein
MAFNPDAYLKEKAGGGSKGGGFDPDAYLASAAAPKKPEPNDPAGAAQAALEHFGNSASLGYLPQLQAGVEQALPDPSADVDSKLKAQGFKIDQKNPDYVSARDANIRRMNQEAADYPGASLAGTLAGAVTSGAATSAIAPINAATKLGRIAQAAKAGALLGSVANPGDIEGEISPIQVGGRIKGALGGAAVGAAGQGAIEGISSVGKTLANLPNKLQGKAEERAFKSAGAMLKDYRKADKEGRINEIGRFMLDNELVKPGMNVNDVAEGSAKIRNDLGDAIGQAYDKAAAALQGADVPAANLSPAKLADEFMSEFGAAQKGAPGGGARLKSVQAVVDDLKSLPGDGGFTAVNKFRQALDDLVYAHDKTPGTLPETKQGLAALRSWLDQRVDGAISAVDRATKGRVSQDLPTLNRQYGLASEVSKISRDQALRQNANRFFSPTDYASAATGAVAGAATGDDLESKLRNAAVGASLGVANRAARRYGTPLVSQGLDKAGALLGKTPIGALGSSANRIFDAIERGPGAAANTARVVTRPKLDPVPLRNVASEDSPPKKGEDIWASQGAQKLGLSSDVMTSVAQSPKGKQLLIQASDLAPGSKAMKRIQDQISKEWGKSNGR